MSPYDGTAGLVGLLHRYVGHEAVRRRAVPVVLARLEEHRVAGPDDLDLSAAALAEPYALGNVGGLPEGVGVPRGPRAAREVDACGPEAGRFRGRGDGVDVDGAGKRLALPGRRLGAAVPSDLHTVLLGCGVKRPRSSWGVSLSRWP